MKAVERHTFKCSKEQKQTLIILKNKYKVNISQFIREAINEKLEKDKAKIFKRFREVQRYLEYPF